MSNMKRKVVNEHITTKSTEIQEAQSKNKGKKGKSKVNQSVRTRSSPHPLYESLRFLSTSQKNTLIEMGFGYLIGMNIHYIPSHLSKYIIQNFNQSRMSIKLRNGSIKITPALIKEVLGIPFGGQRLVKVSDNELIEQWKAQFDKHITPKRVAAMTKKTDGAGIMFKLNFLVVFFNVICASKEDGGSNLDILDFINEDADISNLDWILIYLHCTKGNELNVILSRPALTFWTSDLMKDREDFEIENGSFGNVELIPFDDESFKEQSFQKDLQFVKDKIETRLFILIDEKNKLNKFIADSVLMFPEDIKIKELKGMFDDIFSKKKVDDPDCSHDLNVIGSGAADVNYENQGINDDVFQNIKDPSAKETNHEYQVFEETGAAIPYKEDVVTEVSNLDDNLAGVQTRKRRGRPKKLAKQTRNDETNHEDQVFEETDAAIPYKEDVVTEISILDDNLVGKSSNAKSQTRKRRRRPKKLPKQTQNDETRKTLGRPKKLAKQTQNEESSPAVTVAQASPTSQCSPTAIIHPSTIKMTKKTARRT
ncbi:hypothetical protein Tco_0978910 [Tanacetum coccineum]|uniref:Uncharacterized protein n=1 Tax=Tanacetum coccineum TaxID=301880 RepID=A0ABQ5EP78_9ASTR